MSNNPTNNNTSVPLAIGATFTGLAQSTTGFSNIMVSIRVDKLSELTIQQSANGVHWDLHERWTCDPIKSPTGFVCQTPASLGFFRVLVENLSGQTMTILRVVSIVNMVSNVKLDVRQDNTLVSGEDALGEKHTLQTDASGALVVSAGGSSGLIVQSGQNTDFAFFPDATNSTASIYADGDQPVQTTAAGWVYTNSGVAPNKINWYVFQDTTLPQYLVSEMDSIYFVISQLTPATALPYVAFYTMPNGIDDVVPLFAKSVLVFSPSGSVPTAQGEYLLYVKSDPVHIRPEITNRYELTFVPENSTKTLAQASGERLSLSTLSTNSTEPAGANYFLFQQYGITWAKTSVPLPINNGLLDCNIVSQAPVSLLAGTADIGFVNLKAENLLSNPSTFANLQIVGADLQVADQQAITFLSSIDGYSNSINISTTSIASSNVSMESRLVNIDTKMITLSNGASTKTLTQTGQNWTTDYTTLQSLTLSNVGGLVFSYVKLYNKATAPDQNDTPVMTIPLNHETVQQVACNTLLFDLGIGVRATNAFVANDNTAPSGTVYATAFYKNG
jgi:hypothetical protein